VNQPLRDLELRREELFRQIENLVIFSLSCSIIYCRRTSHG